MNASESSEGFFGLSIGRAVMTSHSRCAKDSASCDTKFCLREHGTSGVGARVVQEFRSFCCFLDKLFLNVVEEFRSCLSKPEGSVCHFWTLYVNQDVVCFSLFAIFEPTDPLWSHTKRTKYCCLAAIELHVVVIKSSLSLSVFQDTERCVCTARLDICVEITHFSR